MQSEVYERCDEVLVCELYVTGVDNTEGTRLDVGVTSQVYISPLGEFVLIASGDVAQIIEIETGGPLGCCRRGDLGGRVVARRSVRGVRLRK